MCESFARWLDLNLDYLICTSSHERGHPTTCAAGAGAVTMELNLVFIKYASTGILT